MKVEYVVKQITEYEDSYEINEIGRFDDVNQAIEIAKGASTGFYSSIRIEVIYNE